MVGICAWSRVAVVTVAWMVLAGDAVWLGGSVSAAEIVKPQTATGCMRLTFTERSPLSDRDEVIRRLDSDLRNMGAGADQKTLEYDLANESFEVFVPPAYRPGVAYGLFVWAGVGQTPAAWNEVFGRHKLICINATHVPGGKGLLRNVQLPLDAVHNMRKRYSLDENRVYVGGFSAGAGLASHLVCAYPEVFRGGYFMMGARFYSTYRNEDGRWETTAERLTPTWKGPLDQIKTDVRLVLMRGENDTVYSPREDRGQCEALLLDGFTRATYIEVPGVAHRLPPVAWFERGIAALDQTRPKTAPTTSPTTRPSPQPGQIAQAQRLLATGRMLLASAEKTQAGDDAKERLRTRARAYLQRVVEEYPATPAAQKARDAMERTAAPSTVDRP